MHISEIAQIAGVTPRAVRHYHKAGVLPEPTRASNGYRVYSAFDLVRLLRIRRLVALGLSLDRIRTANEDSPGINIDSELAEAERELRNKIRTAQAQLDAIVNARSSSIPEAAIIYDDEQAGMRELWADPSVRQVETDVSLLLMAAGGSTLFENLRVFFANQDILQRVALITDRLRRISDVSPADEREFVVKQLSAFFAGWTGPDADPALRELVTEYLSRTLNAAQLDVVRQASKRWQEMRADSLPFQ